MEDATITKDGGELNLAGRFPNVVTTDDLVFALGKERIKILNHEKLMETLLKKNKSTEDAIKQVGPKMESAIKKADSAEKTAKTYEENNRRLDAALVAERKVVTELRREIKGLNENIVTYEKALAKLSGVEKDNEDLAKKLAAAKKTITNLKKKKKKPVKKVKNNGKHTASEKGSGGQPTDA